MKHAEKQISVGVGIILLDNSKVLLGKRNNDPVKASSELHGEGTWTIPGGKLHFGETFEEGARREVLEETGMKVKSLKLVSVSNDKVTDAHFVTIGFLAGDYEGEPKLMEPEEITEWKWFQLSKLPRPLFFPAEKILNNYLGKKVYGEI